MWPDHSHGSPKARPAAPGLTPWKPARDIIDWSLKGKSIFSRAKALSPNTLRRIACGLRKFGGVNAEPFLVMLYGTNDARSLDRPAPTITATGNHIGLAEPFLVQYHANHKGRKDGDGRVKSIAEPLPTQTTENRFGVCEPFLTHITHCGERPGHSIDAPVPTITTAHRGEMALIEPILLGQQSGHNGSPVSSPCPTVATDGAIALVQPFIVKYYGTAKGVSIHDPLDTVTTKDRFLLIEPKTGRAVAELDILFRMLQPAELSAAMSFPAEYHLTGNGGEQVKQIGNAIPINLAEAICYALHQE